MKYKPYTMIGSRETPQDILDLMTAFATKLASEGYTARSGGADGADTCAELGYENYVKEFGQNPDLLEVYLPWSGFNKRWSKSPPYYVASKLDGYEKAQEIAESIHPAWDRCSDGAKTLHTRNVYQILGKDLDIPSLFVVFWAIPTTGERVKGGTNTAVQLGLTHGCKCFNLYHEENRQRVIYYLD